MTKPTPQENVDELLKARRDELEFQRLAAQVANGPELPLTLEEELLGAWQNERFQQRQAAEADKRAKDEADEASGTTPNWLARHLLNIGIGVTIASIVVPFLVQITTGIGTSAILYLRTYALSATFFAVVAAGLRLWAHNGNKNTDALGKMVGYSAAILALWAAIALFGVEALTELSKPAAG